MSWTPLKTRILAARHLQPLPGSSCHQTGVLKDEVLEEVTSFGLTHPLRPSKEDLEMCLIFGDLGFVVKKGGAIKWSFHRNSIPHRNSGPKVCIVRILSSD